MDEWESKGRRSLAGGSVEGRRTRRFTCVRGGTCSRGSCRGECARKGSVRGQVVHREAEAHERHRTTRHTRHWDRAQVLAFLAVPHTGVSTSQTQSCNAYLYRPVHPLQGCTIVLYLALHQAKICTRLEQWQCQQALGSAAATTDDGVGSQCCCSHRQHWPRRDDGDLSLSTRSHI